MVKCVPFVFFPSARDIQPHLRWLFRRKFERFLLFEVFNVTLCLVWQDPRNALGRTLVRSIHKNLRNLHVRRPGGGERLVTNVLQSIQQQCLEILA